MELMLVSSLISGMEQRMALLLIGLLSCGAAVRAQSGKEALGGASDAAQGVFDRQVGPTAIKDASPDYPGGLPLMYKFIGANLVYPPSEVAAGVQGRVDVEFVVKEDGTLDKVHVKRSLSPALDKEALRVVNAMPKWMPGRKDGRPIAMRMIIPVMFRLP